MADFYPSELPIVDSNPMFPVSSPRDSIDLRKEMDKILFGGDAESAKGHWVIYRRMDLTMRSEYWNSDTREAVGGPAWEYTDEVVRTRHLIGRSAGLLSDMEQYTDVGIMNVMYLTYYFEHDVNPKKEDEIYEIDESVAVALTKPNVVPLPYKARYVIREALPFRSDQGGRIEYWVCICRKDVVD